MPKFIENNKEWLVAYLAGIIDDAATGYAQSDDAADIADTIIDRLNWEV